MNESFLAYGIVPSLIDHIIRTPATTTHPNAMECNDCHTTRTLSSHWNLVHKKLLSKWSSDEVVVVSLPLSGSQV